MKEPEKIGPANYVCATCIHVVYHPNGKPCRDCLGTPEEVKANENNYLYRHYEKGDGMTARLEAERRGDVNIVIGGEGEHEVNAKWSLEEAYQQLAKRCEDVGGLVTHLGQYRLELSKSFDPHYYHLEWLNGKFYRIMQVTEKEWWRDRD